jgi:hypothetical protein
MGLKITESQADLIRIAFGIAREKFEANALSVGLPDIAEQFRKQSAELEKIAAHLECQDCAAPRQLVCLNCH